MNWFFSAHIEIRLIVIKEYVYYCLHTFFLHEFIPLPIKKNEVSNALRHLSTKDSCV